MARDSYTHGRLGWKVVPKLRYMYHLVEQARIVNPRLVRNYKMESSMGKVQKVYKASLRGPFEATIQNTTLRKQLFAMFLQWEAVG